MRARQNPYLDEGKPVHRLSYCAFLDVLGFSARAEESYKKELGDELLREFHSIFTRVTKELQKRTEDTPMFYKSFSDNVLLAIPRYSKDMESELGSMMMAASEYQYQMALHGFFIRGGLSIGPLFVDQNSVYGKALIDSYNLESKIAVNPIVVLSDDTAKLVNRYLTYYADNHSPHNRLLLTNVDGRYFINYLDESLIETDDNGLVLDINSLELHRNQIEISLKKYKRNPTVFAKFSWLATYHNHFCDTVAHYPNYSNALKVSLELSQVKFKSPKKKDS